MSTGINVAKQIKVLDEGSLLTPDVSQIDFTGSGITATTVGNNVTVNVVAASGVWGISNISGVYTYYTTLTLAMAAATAGQTIELFADVTETGAVTITLKNGVNINGNGHTYTLNTNDGTWAFGTPVTVETSLAFTNIYVVRSVGSGGCFALGTNGTSLINFSGTRLINTGTGIAFTSGSASYAEITNLYASANSGTAIQTNGPSQILKFCEGRSISGYGIWSVNGGVYYNCLGISSSSAGIYIQTASGIAHNSVGISSSNAGISSTGSCYNCVGRSITSTGFSSSLHSIDCVGISVSGYGFSSSTDSSCFGCSGYSSSNYGTVLFGSTQYCNFASRSDSAPSIWAVNVTSNFRLIQGTAYSFWNNAGGYGIRGNGGTLTGLISNVFFKLSNASAPYLYNDNVATSILLRGNTYQGGAVYNSNITQSIVTTQDNQGNIFI